MNPPDREPGTAGFPVAFSASTLLSLSSSRNGFLIPVNITQTNNDARVPGPLDAGFT